MKKIIIIAGVVLALFAGTLACMTAQHAYHAYLMKGSVVFVDGNTAYLCIGRHDGAQPGQVLKAYRIERAQIGQGSTFRRIESGTVTIQEIVDDHFAKAAINGKVEVGYVVLLEN